MQPGRPKPRGNGFDEHDVVRAILADPRHGAATWDLEEFFTASRDEVHGVFEALAERGVAIETGVALDVGCGVGRSTRALADYFDSCDGVDSVAAIIQCARQLNGGREHVRFHLSEEPSLGLFGDGSFDFVLSLTALRYPEPQVLRSYLCEFLRVLRPGGVAFFSVPERRVSADELPAEAGRAALTLVGEIPRFVAGGMAPLSVKVRNESSLPWPASALLQVRQRWRDSTGRIVAVRDAATLIRSDLEPASEHEVQLAIVAPVVPGEYELEIDVVQDSLGWFGDRGSSTLKLPVTLVSDGEPDVSHAIMPQTEMHVMAREEVIGTLEYAGGVVLGVAASDRSGRSVEGLDYIVARRVTPALTRSRGGPSSGGNIVESRIRRALKHGDPAWSVVCGESDVEDRQQSDQRRFALRLLEDRADLVGFALTSKLKGFGRASTALRESLRRALFQILYRQTEYNRASQAVIHGHELQLQALRATIRAQLEIEAAGGERLDALDRRLAAVEVTSIPLTRRAAREVERRGRPRVEFPTSQDWARAGADEIRERQRRYVAQFAGRLEVVDIGCGRGQFLELLREAGIGALGVDSDPGMVRRCRELGLAVTHADAVHFLQGRPRESHGGIFAGHLLEHLDRDEVVELVRLAFSRMMPGGVLVVETVNPMSLHTHATFHEDLTRTGPVPPLALKGLAESCGFAPIDIEFSSPTPDEYKLKPLPSLAGDESEVEAFNQGIAAANDLLFGFQEYAMVAFKPA